MSSTMALAELIFSDRTVVYTDVAEAEAALSALCADVRLDYHGVADLLPREHVLPPHTCIISFVGRQSQTRIDTREEIQVRVAGGQVDFGLLVFKRGTSRPGTKAWANRLIQQKLPVALFVDDSEDHITTTMAHCGDRIKPWLFQGTPFHLMMGIGIFVVM
jgi:hypothetical protein